jgi:uncharacterized protein YukJ
LSARWSRFAGRAAPTTPHYQIHLRDDDGVEYRIAVNVQSQQKPSELLYLVVDDFQHPVTATLESVGSGWTPLVSDPGGVNLDYIRGNLFDPATMRLLPPEVPARTTTSPTCSTDYVRRDGVVVFAFGERWGPENGKADKVFGFGPGNGVHDIHMNQGNSAAFRRDDGVWQDGGFLLHPRRGVGSDLPGVPESGLAHRRRHRSRVVGLR